MGHLFERGHSEAFEPLSMTPNDSEIKQDGQRFVALISFLADGMSGMAFLESLCFIKGDMVLQIKQ